MSSLHAATKLVFTYAAFAAVATAANIVTQNVAVHVYTGGFSILLSVLAGTALGLAVKYILDKTYIFKFRPQNAAHDGRIFALYVLMGIATTVIFWATEFAFQHVFGTAFMRYLGAAVGLAVGYAAKYQLDKRFVFPARAAS